MEVKALQQILTQFRQMQENLQKQVENVHVEASAGGGMVTVRMNGQKQLTEIRIDPEIFAGRDQELLQDLVRAAVNEAGRRVDEELTTQMKSLTNAVPGMAGLKIPGLF
jgi:DNA-binding YbaB/EbfC family protein